MIRALAAAVLLVSAAGAQLHTSGRYIVDTNGNRVKLAAVNWYGAEEKDFVVAGLDYAPLAAIAHQIRVMGFNAVRLPWSNQMYESNPVIAPARLAANPSLQGSHALDVLDAVISALAGEGLYVILDNHTSTADWCCSSGDVNSFWYNSAYPESSWLADWQGMAARYASQPAVVGADLRNEPRGPVWGGSNPSYDWHAAAERGGNAVLAGNPNLLIFVEGINFAGDLSGVAALPVVLNVTERVVYSSHDYSWFHSGAYSYNTLASQLDSSWGYLLNANAPVWVGEFGTCHTSATCIASTKSSDTGYWFADFCRYMQERDLDWSYWALNGTEATGTGRTLGAEETYGILSKNWTGVASAALLNSLQAVSAPTATPVIASGGIVNAATFQAGVPLVPGSISTVFGANMAPVATSAAAFPAPTILGGGQIRTTTGVAAPILYASSGQMNIQTPWELDPNSSAGLLSVVGSLISGPEPIHLAPAAPAIFLLGDTQGAVVIANTATVASPTRPAHPGEYISIFCTGLGAVTNQPPTGAAAPSSPLAPTAAAASVAIGGLTVTPTFSGLAPGYVGLYQINVQVPANVPVGDRVPLSVTIAGVPSNTVTIAIAAQ